MHIICKIKRTNNKKGQNKNEEIIRLQNITNET